MAKGTYNTIGNAKRTVATSKRVNSSPKVVKPSKDKVYSDSSGFGTHAKHAKGNIPK